MNSKTSDQTHESSTRAGGADGSLGEELRRAREARGVTLREISEQTRITMRHLEAIEANDYKHLPGGIFNRSFVKAYARYIGFDEDRALELYARTARERGESIDDSNNMPQRSRVYTDGDTARSPLLTFFLSALMVGVLILIVYAALHYYRRTENPAVVAPAPTPATATAAPTPVPAQETPQETTPQANVAADFEIQVRARDRAFWLTSWQDEEKKRGRFLRPDAPETFKPQTSLTLFFDKVSADTLEVSVGGQTLKPPTNDAGKEIEWKITKDNYKQFSQ